VFSTAADSQPQVEVHVLQGERDMAVDNKSLGRFVLDGIPPAPRGVPQIEVTFDIDANGILQVSAKDKGTGKEQKIRIEGSSGISKEEINRMQTEAAAHAEEDKKKRDLIEMKNQAEQAIYSTEKTLKELGDKADAATKTAIEEKITALKGVKDGSDAVAIKTALDALMSTSQKLGEQLYKQQAASAPQEPPKTGSENVVDADAKPKG